MRFGDAGHLFYIILKGRVSVIVPRNPGKALAAKKDELSTDQNSTAHLSKLVKDELE